MGMVFTIVGYAIFGLVIGFLARFLVPGPDPMGWIATSLLGISGSFLGGFGYNIFVNGAEDPLAFEPSSYLGSLGGAVVLVLLMRLFGLRRKD